MTNDIVRLLLNPNHARSFTLAQAIMRDAAQEIERLRQQVQDANEVIDTARSALKMCSKAEKERRKKLLPGSPAETYCARRVAILDVAINSLDLQMKNVGIHLRNAVEAERAATDKS